MGGGMYLNWGFKEGWTEVIFFKQVSSNISTKIEWHQFIFGMNISLDGETKKG